MTSLTEQIVTIAAEIQKQAMLYHTATISDFPIQERLQLARKIRDLQSQLNVLTAQLKDNAGNV